MDPSKLIRGLNIAPSATHSLRPDLLLKILSLFKDLEPWCHVPRLPQFADSVHLLRSGDKQITLYTLPVCTLYGRWPHKDLPDPWASAYQTMRSDFLVYAKRVHGIDESKISTTCNFEGSIEMASIALNGLRDFPVHPQTVASGFIAESAGKVYASVIWPELAHVFVCAIDGVSVVVELEKEGVTGDVILDMIKSHIEKCGQPNELMRWEFDGLKYGQVEIASNLGLHCVATDTKLEMMRMPDAESYIPAYQTKAVMTLTHEQMMAINEHAAAWGEYLKLFWITGGTVTKAITGTSLKGSDIDVVPRKPGMTINELIDKCPFKDVYVFHTPRVTTLIRHSGGGHPRLLGIPELQIIHLTPRRYSEMVDLTAAALMVGFGSCEVRTPLRNADKLECKVCYYEPRRSASLRRSEKAKETVKLLEQCGWVCGGKEDKWKASRVFSDTAAMGSAAVNKPGTPMTCYKRLGVSQCNVRDIALEVVFHLSEYDIRRLKAPESPLIMPGVTWPRGSEHGCVLPLDVDIARRIIRVNRRVCSGDMMIWGRDPNESHTDNYMEFIATRWSDVW